MMVFGLTIVSLCELALGLAMLTGAINAVPQILGTLMVGFSFVTLALSAILQELKWARKNSEIIIDR